MKALMRRMRKLRIRRRRRSITMNLSRIAIGKDTRGSPSQTVDIGNPVTKPIDKSFQGFVGTDSDWKSPRRCKWPANGLSWCLLMSSVLMSPPSLQASLLSLGVFFPMAPQPYATNTVGAFGGEFVLEPIPDLT